MWHAQPDFDILFVKFTAQIGYFIWKTSRGWGYHAKDILEGDLDYRALLDLPNCISQTLGEDIHVFAGMLRERGGR